GPASDVYALGAILYEALTGRPPFRGETALDIWELVRSQEPIPPRQLAPKVPRDLETICLKCLAKQPEQRYASALGLAEDLKRFLEGEPISARPVGRAERAVRWCRRNPVVAMLSGGIALALVCGTVISTTLAVWALSAKNRAAMHARQAGANSQQAQAARELAEYRFTQAEKAVEEYLDGIESNARLKEADFLDLRKQLLTSAVPFYEEFVRQKPNDAALEAKRGRAYGRLGQLRGHLGEHQRAESDIRQMMAIFQKLAADFPGFAEYRQQEARAQHSLSILLYESGKQEDALAEIRRAVALEQQLIAAAPSSNAYRQDLARSRAMLGMLLHGLGSHDAAVAEYQKVFALEQPLADEFPKNPAYRVDLARSHNNLASVLEALGKRPESVDEMRKALSLGQELSAEFPRVPAYRQDLVRSHYNLAALFTRLRQWPQAEVEHRQSITLGKSLVEEFPTVPAYRADLARSHYNLGRMLRDRGRLGEAEVEYREALTLRAKLNADVSGIAEYRANLAQSHAGMGSVFGALGKRADAIAELQRAAEVWTPLLQGFPDRLEYRTSMASHLNSLALFLREDGKLDEARLMHNVAIEHCLVVFKAAPKKRTYAASLSGYYRELGDTALLQKDHAQVAESAHQLAQTRSDIAADAVLAARFLGRCVTLAEHDEQLTADERQLLANSYADQAVAHLREAIRRGYKNVASLKDLAALAPLRDRADFQQLLQELSAQ
ncbi:MAG TPA: tetratricopeptide repeat protein, partial [Pirellulaceae bacterium]|nr:tetratricopeptide repeat protein [Pirellulaceae bacterium]